MPRRVSNYKAARPHRAPRKPEGRGPHGTAEHYAELQRRADLGLPLSEGPPPGRFAGRKEERRADG